MATTDGFDPAPLAQTIRGLQDELTAASVALWRVLATIEPDLLHAQQALGWSDSDVAHWLAGEVSTTLEPVYWNRQVQAWLGQLRRTAHGFPG